MMMMMMIGLCARPTNSKSVQFTTADISNQVWGGALLSMIDSFIRSLCHFLYTSGL